MNFRSRSRFNRSCRRDIGTTGTSSLVSDLASRLTSFKSLPVITGDDCFASHHRPLLFRACGVCTPHCGATLTSESLASLKALSDALSKQSDLISPSFKCRDVSVAGLEEIIVQKRAGRIADTDDYFSKEEEEGEPASASELSELFGRLNLNIFSGWIHKFGIWVLNTLLSFLYPRGLIYHPGQCEVLQRTLMSENPLIFLPVNQSALDPVIVQCVLRKCGIEVFRVETEHVTKPFSTYLGGGLSSFPWYQLMDAKGYFGAVQQQVMENLMEHGHHFLIFLDEFRPTLTECLNKESLLVIGGLFQALDNPAIADVKIVPTSISYDRRIEDLSWRQAIKSWINGNVCGRVRVDFDQPFSLRSFSANTKKRCKLEAAEEADVRLVKELVSHVLWNNSEIRRPSVTDVFKYLKLHDLTLASFLRNVQSKNKDVSFSGDPNALLQYHDSLVKVQFEGPFSPSKVPFFLHEAIVAVAVCSMLQVSSLASHVGTASRLQVGSFDSLIEKCKLLANLLEMEFVAIRAPCQDLEHGIRKAIDWFKIRNIIEDDDTEMEKQKGQHFQERRSRQLARYVDMSIHDDGDNDLVKNSKPKWVYVRTSESTVRNLLSFRNVILPSIELYHDVIVKLIALVDVDYVSEEELFEIIVAADSEPVSRPVSVGRLKAVVSRLEEMKVIATGVTTYKGRHHVVCVWLTDDWNSARNLTDLSHRILQFMT